MSDKSNSSEKACSDLPSTETISIHKCEESLDNKPEFSEQDCSTVHSNLMTAPNINSEDSSTHNVKKEFNEEVLTPSSPKVSSPEDISTLDVKVEFTEQDSVKEFNEEVCATPSSPKVSSPEDISTLDVKVEFTEQDTVKEFNEEVCATPSSPKVSSPEDISTLDVKVEFTEQDTVKEFNEEVCATPSSAKVSSPEDISTLDVKVEFTEQDTVKEFNEEVCATPSSAKVSSPADINTLDVKVEFTEQDTVKEFNEEVCATPSSPKVSSPADISTVDVKVEFTEQDTVKEFNEEVCATPSSPKVSSPEDISTLDVQVEFTEQDTVSLEEISTPIVSDTPFEDSTTFKLKEESTENNSTIVSTPIIYLSGHPREDISNFRDKVQLADQDWSTVSLTGAISPDVIKEIIGNYEVGCPESDAPSTQTIHCPDSVKDSETQENWSSVPTAFLPDTIREDNCTHNVQIELDKVSVTASNPLISDPDKSKERREFTEQECSMVLSNSTDTQTTGKHTNTSNVKNVCSKKCCMSVLPPIIFLPDNLHEDIRKLMNNIEFADQDWSRVPSKPKLSLLENKVTHSVVPSNLKTSLKKFSPTAMFKISLPRKKHVYQVSTAVSSINQTKVIPHAKFAPPSNVPSNPRISHGHSVSGIAADTTSIKKTNQLLPQPASTQPQGTNFSAPKQSVSVQNNNCLTSNTPLPKKKKLSNSVRRRKVKLIAHGVPEELASDLCLLQIPELLEKIPSLKPVFQSAKQKSHTTAINTSKSTDKFICMEPALKIPDSRIKPRNSKYTVWRVGIWNLTPMDKEQMTMVHRRLVLAIANMNTYGGGPEFLNFKQMDGWILVTGVDQRSRAWLLDELQYLELWPGAQLSIMPEQKIPEPTVAKIVAFIPESEATTVKEALDLLRAQNKGLNTEQWKLVDERIGIGKKWTVTFMIDEDSLETIRAQGCKASIGFTKMLVIPVEDNGSNSKPHSPEDISNCQDSSQKTPIPSPDNYVLSGNSVRTNPVESQTQLQNRLQSAQCEGPENNPTEPCSGNVNMKSDGPKNLYTRDRNRDRQVIENKRRIEEASMPGGEKRFKANRDGYIDKFGSEMRIVNGSKGGVEPQQITRDLMANTIGTDLGYFSMGSSVGGPGFDTRGTFIQNISGTEDITLTQQNGVLAPVAGSVIGLSQTIVDMVPPSINQGNRATGGTNNFTVTPQNNTIAGYSDPMVNMSITGEERNTVPPSNIVSDLTAAETDVQEMDYFLGPGGGSQFIRNQRFQNLFSCDAAQQTAVNVYLMNTSSNLSYNMNHHQVFQNEMSSENQDHSWTNAGVQMSEGHGSHISRNSSPTREDSEEGYKSWIIQDADSFATNTAEHTMTDTEPQPTRMGEELNEDGPSSDQNTNSSSHLDRLYHQAGDNEDHSFGRRSYDDGSSKPDGRSSRASSWNKELADFERSRKYISPRRHRILPKARQSRFSDIDGRAMEERADGSHVRSNCKDQVIEERMWTRRDRADRDRHLNSDNPDFNDSHRNRREWPNDRERSHAGRRNIQDSASSHTRNTFIRDQGARDDVRNIRGFTREPRFPAHRGGVRREDVLPRR